MKEEYPTKKRLYKDWNCQQGALVLSKIILPEQKHSEHEGLSSNAHQKDYP